MIMCWLLYDCFEITFCQVCDDVGLVVVVMMKGHSLTESGGDTDGHALLLLSMTGLFMALQPRIIACGNSIAAFAMAVRFLTGPAVMAAASIAVGLKGVLLHVAIVQVSLSLSLSCAPFSPQHSFIKLQILLYFESPCYTSTCSKHPKL